MRCVFALACMACMAASALGAPERGPLRCHVNSSKCIFHAYDLALAIKSGAKYAPVNYATAQSWCTAFSARVVSVATATEAANVAVVSRFLLGTTTQHWVGLDDTAIEGIYAMLARLLCAYCASSRLLMSICMHGNRNVRVARRLRV